MYDDCGIERTEAVQIKKYGLFYYCQDLMCMMNVFDVFDGI